MALFGRRKPGFSKEVMLKPSEIPDHFSDALDPAVNKELDNPKLEKQELQAAAAAVTGEEKPDMIDFEARHDRLHAVPARGGGPLPPL